MAALRLIWATELRRHGAGWLALALVGGLAFGIAFAVAEAAHRASTAVARYDAATAAETGEVAWVKFAGGPRIDLAAAGRLPGVAASARVIDFIALGLVSPGGVIARPGDYRFKVPAGPGFTQTVERPLIRAGRLPSPTQPNEVMVDQVMASRFRLHLGSIVRARLFTTAEAHALIAGEANWVEHADPRRDGAGPLVRLRVVGIQVLLDDVDPQGDLIASASFTRQYRRYLATAVPYLAVRLDRPADGFPAFASEVAALYPRGAPVAAASAAPFRTPITDQISLQATTLWLFAVVAGAIAFVGFAPALARRTLHGGAEQEVFRVLGLRRRSMFAATMVGPLVVASGAVATAVLVGLVASPLTAVGVARPFDPASGIWLDSQVLVVGTASVVGSLLLVGALGALRRVAQTGDERRSSTRAGRSLGPRLTALGVPVALGVGSALSGGTGRLRVPLASTMATIVAMLALVTASLVVAASSARLLDTPRLYGQNFTLLGETGGLAPRVAVRVSRGLARERTITAATENGVATVTINGQSVGVLGTRPLKGVVPLSLTSGRALSGAAEIVLGTKTIKALGVRVGDTVNVRGKRRQATMRVAGAATLPNVFWDSQGVSVGDGAVVTLGALRSLVPGTSVSRFLIQLAPGVDPIHEDAALTQATKATFDPPLRPTIVGKVNRVRSVPYELAALIAAAAVASLAHLLIATTRRRRREIAILKTLGLRRRDVSATVFVQSATTVAIGCLLGIPLGAIIGYRIWNALAGRLGVVPEPVLPLTTTALLIPAALVLCVAVAVVPAALAARVPAADVLRAE